jgi:hypothetical protein
MLIGVPTLTLSRRSWASMRTSPSRPRARRGSSMSMLPAPAVAAKKRSAGNSLVDFMFSPSSRKRGELKVCQLFKTE